MGITGLYVRATYTGTKAQNVKWGGTDYTGLASETTQGEVCILQVAVSSAVAVQVTVDGGTTWVSLNSGISLTPDCLYQFTIFVAGGELFNVRTSSAAGTTIRTAELTSDVDG